MSCGVCGKKWSAITWYGITTVSVSYLMEWVVSGLFFFTPWNDVIGIYHFIKNKVDRNNINSIRVIKFVALLLRISNLLLSYKLFLLKQKHIQNKISCWYWTNIDTMSNVNFLYYFNIFKITLLLIYVDFVRHIRKRRGQYKI